MKVIFLYYFQFVNIISRGWRVTYFCDIYGNISARRPAQTESKKSKSDRYYLYKI